MQALETYLLSFPPETLLFVIAGLMFVTCLGILPNNTDVTIMVASFLSSNGHIQLWQVMVICILGYFLGEGLMFSIGRKLGPKVQKIKLVKKILPEKRQEFVLKRIHTRPLLFFIGVRITPLLRPWFIMGLGSLNLSPKIYIRYHMGFTFLYTVFLSSMSYLFASIISQHFDEYKLWFGLAFCLLWLLLIRKVLSSKELEV